jgi:heme-degrading monooxygenase HmoA
MIARIWRGRTPQSKAADYVKYVEKTGIAEYRRTPGNRAALILTQENAAKTETEFLVLTLWDSLDSIRAFAGADVEAAKYYPEDAGFLLNFEPKVNHYELPVAVIEPGIAENS